MVRIRKKIVMREQVKPEVTFDFGFSAVSEDELKEYERQQIDELAKRSSSVTQEALVYKNRLETMYKMILPLLVSLQKDPQKEYILWPNREAKIREFKQKLDQLVND